MLKNIQYNIRWNSQLKGIAKTLSLENDPQLIEDYKKVHAPGAVWPEITQGMRDVGILDMEIYLLGTRLFMIMDTVAGFDHDKAMSELAGKPRPKRMGSIRCPRFRKLRPKPAPEKSGN